MAKIYLVDSENIGASWSQLLNTMSEEDRMYVFYTDKSPYISYENLLQVIAYCNIPIFVKCYEGRNALDFQLVSELGFKLCQEPDQEFIVISDDYGYDAAIRYWTGKGYNVHRIGKKYCRPMYPRKSEEVSVVQSEVTAVPVVEKIAEAEAELSVEIVPEQIQEQELTQEPEQVQEEETVQEVIPVEAPEVQEPAIEEPEVQEPAGEEPEVQEPAEQQAEAEKSEPKRTKSRRRRRKEAVAEPTEDREMKTEEVREPVDPLDAQILEVVKKCESLEPEKDAQSVKELYRTLSMSNLTTVNTAMKILFGNEVGNDIYRELKEHQEYREQLDALYYPTTKERFMHYVQIVLGRSELQDVSAEEMGKFLFRIPRKNLNSIRSAILKEYGNELGSQVYTVYKPHIKVLNKM